MAIRAFNSADEAHVTHTNKPILETPRSRLSKGAVPHFGKDGSCSPRSFTGRAFTICLALIPVLEIYKSPVPGVPLSKPFLALFLLSAIISRLADGRPRFVAGASAPLTLVAGLVFGTILASFAVDELNNEAILRRFVLLALWAFVAFYCVPMFVDIALLFRAVVFLAILATAYLLVQYGSSAIFHILLPNVVEIGPLRAGNPGYVDAESLQAHYRWFFYRPASFLGEPQYYSDYVTLALVIVLFRQKVTRVGPLTTALFLSLGLLVSTSTTAVVMVILVWTIWLLGSFFENLAWADLALRATIGLLAPIAAVLVLSLPIMQQVLFSKLGDIENQARLGRSFDLYFSLDQYGKVFGIGIGNEDDLLSANSALYINSVTAILLGCGVMGVLLLSIYWLKLIRLPGNVSRILVVVYVILSATGSILYADRSLLYLAVILLCASQIGGAHAGRTSQAGVGDELDFRAGRSVRRI